MEKPETKGSLVIVTRCAGAPVPPVPSQTVQCGGCGADCWLSAKTGAGTLGLARSLGHAAITCLQCLDEMVAQGAEVIPCATPDAISEARGSGN